MLKVIAFFLLSFWAAMTPINMAQAGETVFEDHFAGVERLMQDGSKKRYPDRTKWAFTFWPGTVWPDSYGDGTNWLAGNTECQTYVTPWLEWIKGSHVPANLRYDPFTITQEGLSIKADVLTPAQRAAYKTEADYRMFGSGLLLSRTSFKYGKIRVVAKLPSARGSWPAIWLLASARQWPPEIDILEGMAWGPHKNEIHSGMLARSEDKNKGFGKWFDVGVDPSQGFHEYGLDWNKDTMAMTFDGKTLWTKKTPESMNQEMYLIINLAVGGKWPYNEVGIKPTDDESPERLKRGSDMIAPDYPAAMIIKSVSVTR